MHATSGFCRLATYLGGFWLLLLGSGQAQAQSAPPPPPAANADRVNSISSLLGSRYDPWLDPTRGSHAPSSPGDEDLGEQLILTPLSVYKPFNFQIAQQAMWTDNAALTDGDELSDFYSNTELRLSYMPQIWANTYAQFDARYSFYRYADHSSLDFDNLEAAVGLLHVLRDLNDLSVWLHYNHTRLLTASGGDELFTDHAIEAGLYLPITLHPRHIMYAGYTSEFSLDANPGYSGRHEHTLSLGYRFRATDRIHLESYYQFAYYDYREGGRDDLLHSAGIALTTYLTERIDLVLSANYSLNDSDLAGADYEVGDLGALLSLRFEF